jgi:N-acetylglucosamine malate deacetylase 1
VTTLFLFAHQDDEFGVFHEIAETLARGERAVCIYLTNGAWKKVTPEIRNAESLQVLQRVGVPASDIHFLGTEIGIADSTLANNFQKSWDALLKLSADIGGVTRVVMHAYEGGHHDHDAGHVLGLTLAKQLNVFDTSRQFPLYRGPGGRFVVTYAVPMESNGPVNRARIPWGKRLQYLMYLRFYRSQVTTIVKIGPLMARDFISDGCQKLQPLSLSRVLERPRPGELLYETWKLYDYEKFSRNTAAFLAKQNLTDVDLNNESNGASSPQAMTASRSARS